MRGTGEDSAAALLTHPWVVAVCETVLGRGYSHVDTPVPSAHEEQWHRDVPACTDAHKARRITSLVFEVTTASTPSEMGALELAPGTHWETGSEWQDGLYPPESEWPRYAQIAQRRLSQIGDIIARSPLAVHRSTAGRSQHVIVLRVAAAGARL